MPPSSRRTDDPSDASDGGGARAADADPADGARREPGTVRQDPPSGLRRAIGPKLLFLFVLGDVLGAGIYTLVGEIATEVGGAVWLPLLVALALALVTAVSYAELVTRFPRAGGAAVFVQEAFHLPALSFVVGFSMLAAGVTSAASLALAFGGDYLGELVALPAAPVGVAFLVVAGLLNLRGIKDSLGANVVMTFVEVGGLLLVVGLGAAIVLGGDGLPGQVLQVGDGTGPAAATGGVLAASVLAFYSYVGFETSANVAEELSDVRRTYPRALFASLLVAGGVYALLGLVVAATVPVAEFAGSTGPLLEVVARSPLPLPGEVFSLVALVAIANGALLTMIMASRLTYGMAQQGLLPAALGRVLPGRRTPWAAVLATTVVAAALVLTGSVEELAETVVLLLLVVFLGVHASVLALHGRPDGEPDHFRAPRALPVLAILASLALLTQQDAATWLRAGLLLAVGLVVWGVPRLLASRRG